MDPLALGDIPIFDSDDVCLSGGPARSDSDTLSVGTGRAVEPLRMTIRTHHPSTSTPSSSSTGNHRILVGAGNTFVAHSHLPSSSSTIPSSYSVRPRSSTSSTTTRPTTAKSKKFQANGSSEVAELRNDVQSLRSMVQLLAQSTNDIVTRLNEQDTLNRLHATQNRNRMTDFSSTGLDNSQPRLETRTRQINIDNQYTNRNYVQSLQDLASQHAPFAACSSSSSTHARSATCHFWTTRSHNCSTTPAY